MQNASIFWHSRTYYRNTSLAIVTALAALLLALTYSGHWVSVISLMLLIYLNYFIWQIYFSIHPRRRMLDDPAPPFFAEMQIESVQFTSRDGFTLHGMFVPGANRKAVILAHGLGGTGMSLIHHARMLQNAGYSVLVPDLRAHGKSEGDTITGVAEANDILGALDYLSARPEVNPDSIGALGISFGGRIVLLAARQAPQLKAIILESVGPAVMEDHGGRPTTFRRWINYPFNLFIYWLFDFMTGVPVNEGMITALRKISPRPVLLIAAGRGKERHFMRIFHQHARQPKSLWEVEEAHHGLAYAYRKQSYPHKVIAFFDRYL